MRTVLVFGTFDILHPGHVQFLRAARRKGDRLIVVVSRDKRVRHEKGHAPVMNEQERLSLVTALRSVDRAVLGDRVGGWNAIKRLKPDLICVGYDQNIPAQTFDIPLVRLPRFASRRHKSTLIKSRIKRYA